jgi:hypothetical protein
MPYRHFFFLTWFAFAVLASALVASPAWADDNAEARVYFEQGNRALTRGMNARGARRTELIEEAVAAYVRSLSIVRSRNVIYNAGVALEALGRDEEAFAYFREYLADSDLSDDERREATNKINAIRTRVAVVSVESTPPGSFVIVDRRDLAPIGVTPIEVAVSEGPHTIYVSAEGHTSAESRIVGRPGQRESVTVTLRAEPVALSIRAPAGTALTLNGRTVAANTDIDVMPGDHEIRAGTSEPIRVTIRAGEGRRVVDIDAPSVASAGPPGLLGVTVNVAATVYVDDALVETGREIEASVASGARSVRVEAEGYATATARVDVPEGGEARLTVRLEEDVSGSSRLGKSPGVFLAAGGFVALAAAGIGTAAIFQNRDFEEPPVGTTEDADRIDTLNLTADICFGVGAALALTGVILALVNGDSEQTESRIEVAATPLDGGGLLVARGSFGGAR